MVVIPVMLQRIMALPPETLDSYDLSSGQGGRRVGVRAARRPRHPVDGPVRGQPLQHLRLHRGRLRDDRLPRRPAPGTWYGGPAAVRDRREDPRRGRPRGRAGGVGPDLRPQQHPVRGVHRRRQQGHGRRADGHRRRRPLRRGRPARRRGPRRRDDRLRRGERLPAGGRGQPEPRTRRSTRRRRSASTTSPGASGCARSSCSRTAPRRARTSSRTTCAGTSRATRCRGRSCSSTSCRATRPARSSSASCRSTTWGTSLMALEIGQQAPDFALRDQHGATVSLSSYRGDKAVVVMFYPFAFSRVCTGELSDGASTTCPPSSPTTCRCSRCPATRCSRCAPSPSRRG